MIDSHTSVSQPFFPRPTMNSSSSAVMRTHSPPSYLPHPPPLIPPPHPNHLPPPAIQQPQINNSNNNNNNNNLSSNNNNNNNNNNVISYANNIGDKPNTIPLMSSNINVIPKSSPSTQSPIMTSPIITSPIITSPIVSNSNSNNNNNNNSNSINTSNDIINNEQEQLTDTVTAMMNWDLGPTNDTRGTKRKVGSSNNSDNNNNSNNNNNKNGEEKEVKDLVVKLQKLTHDTHKVDGIRCVHVKFAPGVILKAKKLFQEPWGTMVSALEDYKALDIAVGQKYWTRWDGETSPYTSLPVYQAVHSVADRKTFTFD